MKTKEYLKSSDKLSKEIRVALRALSTEMRLKERYTLIEEIQDLVWQMKDELQEKAGLR